MSGEAIEGTGTGVPFPVRPIRDLMVVEEVKFDAESKIIMPDTAKSRLGARYGRVVTKGLGLIHPVTGERVPMDVEVGDVVMHREYSGTPFKHAGKPYLLLPLDDVVSVVDEHTFDPMTYLSSKSAASGLPGLGSDKLIIPKS